MKDLFVGYEESLKLKELGFDDECIATYWDDKLYVHGIQSLETVKGSGLHNRNLSDSVITAPLYSQAFEWFRVKHNISSYIRADWQPDWNAYSYQCYFNQDKEQFNLIKYYKTYEEAQLACLQELIKMVSE